MNAFNHYGTLIVTCWLTGYIIGYLFPAPGSLVLSLIAGITLGLTWRKITGYKPKENNYE